MRSSESSRCRLQSQRWRSPAKHDATWRNSTQKTRAFQSLSLSGGRGAGSSADWIDLDNPAQFDDLVSHQRSFLELEIARGLFHLRFEVLYHAGNLVLWQLR